MHLENIHWYIDGQNKYVWHWWILRISKWRPNVWFWVILLQNNYLYIVHRLYDLPINGKDIKDITFGARVKFDTLP